MPAGGNVVPTGPLAEVTEIEVGLASKPARLQDACQLPRVHHLRWAPDRRASADPSSSAVGWTRGGGGRGATLASASVLQPA